MITDDEKYSYELLSKRHLNDDGLLNSRTSIYLVSNSILFLGFINIYQKTQSKINLISIPLIILGLFFAFLSMLSNRRTKKGLDFWEEKEKWLEENAESFKYLREKQLTPHLVHSNLDGIPNRVVNAYIIPILFLGLWSCSLIWTCIP